MWKIAVYTPVNGYEYPNLKLQNQYGYNIQQLIDTQAMQLLKTEKNYT